MLLLYIQIIIVICIDYNKRVVKFTYCKNIVLLVLTFMFLLMLGFGFDIETKVQVLKPQLGQIKVHVLKLMFGQNFELQFKHLGLLCLSQCCLCQKQNTVTIVSACMLSQTKTSHTSVDEATFLLTFHCPVAVVKKCILFKERMEKVSFQKNCLVAVDLRGGGNRYGPNLRFPIKVSIFFNLHKSQHLVNSSPDYH